MSVGSAESAEWISEMVFMAYPSASPDILTYQGPECRLQVSDKAALIKFSDQRVGSALWPHDIRAANAFHALDTHAREHRRRFRGLRTAHNVQLLAERSAQGILWHVVSHGTPQSRLSITDDQGLHLQLSHRETPSEIIPANARQPRHLRETQITLRGPGVSSYVEAHNFQALLFSLEGRNPAEEAYHNFDHDQIEARPGQLVIQPAPGPAVPRRFPFNFQLTPSRKAKLIDLLRSAPLPPGES